jgi:hypothetical protein
MFDRAVTNTAIRYGVTGGIVSFIYIAILALLGLENPYDDTAEFSSTFIFVSAFVFLAIKYYKKFNDAEIGFGKAFKIGLFTTFYLAFTTAVLMALFSQFAGGHMIQEYIQAKQVYMEANRQAIVQVMGELNYSRGLEGLKQLTGYDLAQRSFLYRMITGFFISIILGVFFRK